MASALTVILFVGVFLVLTFANPTSRILGGEELDKNSHAYVASVRLDGSHVCGCSIIGSRYVLTAAHCIKENDYKIAVNRLTVRVGSSSQFSGGELFSVIETFIHPNYTVEKNDIAVLRLESPLQWTNRIAKIEIATTTQDEPEAGDLVRVAGWGEQSPNTSSYKLHSILFSIANEDICLDAFNEMDDSNICLSHELKKGSCVGDAGNGAVYNGKLVAVSSFVIGACGSRYPEIFSNVSYFASWIKSVAV